MNNMPKCYRRYGSLYHEKIAGLKIGDKVKYTLYNGAEAESEIVGFTPTGKYRLENGKKFCQDGSSYGAINGGYAYLVFDYLLIGGE